MLDYAISEETGSEETGREERVPSRVVAITQRPTMPLLRFSYLATYEMAKPPMEALNYKTLQKSIRNPRSVDTIAVRYSIYVLAMAQRQPKGVSLNFRCYTYWVQVNQCASISTSVSDRPSRYSHRYGIGISPRAVYSLRTFPNSQKMSRMIRAIASKKIPSTTNPFKISQIAIAP